jgi:hypothetical protein
MMSFAPGAGDDAELDLRLAHGGARRREPEIGAHGQLQAAAQAVPVDRGDHHSGELLHRREHVLHRGDRRLDLDRREAGHHLDVRPRSEDLLAAVQDQGPDVLGGDRLASGLAEVPQQVAVDRVHGRAVQPDGSHRAVDLEPNELPHLGSS